MSNCLKHFVNSHKILLYHKKAHQGRFRYSMFTPCSPTKEKAPAESL